MSTVTSDPRNKRLDEPRKPRCPVLHEDVLFHEINPHTRQPVQRLAKVVGVGSDDPQSLLSLTVFTPDVLSGTRVYHRVPRGDQPGQWEFRD